MALNGCLVQEHRGMVLTDADPAGLVDQFKTSDPSKVDKWIEKKRVVATPNLSSIYSG
jgi:hypothetical protein